MTTAETPASVMVDSDIDALSWWLDAQREIAPEPMRQIGRRIIDRLIRAEASKREVAVYQEREEQLVAYLNAALRNPEHRERLLNEALLSGDTFWKRHTAALSAGSGAREGAV